MKNLDSSNFALFFTRGLSLQKWDRLGMLAREIRPYQELSKYFKKVYLCTYGTSDQSYAHLFSENVIILERPRWIPANLYSICLPVIHASIFRTIDIAKSNQMDGSWAAVIAKKIFKCRLVIRCGYEWLDFLKKRKRAWWKNFFAYMVEKLSYRNADRISITSAAGKEFIVRTFSIPTEKIQVIPNYIDAHKFKPLLVDKIPDRILFLGRFEDQKNLFNLIDAMANVPAHLALIGSGSQRAALEARAQERGVKTLWLGNISQDNLPMELNKAQIFVLPSLYEGNPKALLEAMSCGLPCIGTNVDGISNVITDQETGLLCETDTQSIHDAFMALLNNTKLQAHIGKGARQMILDTCSFERVIEQEIALHRSLLLR